MSDSKWFRIRGFFWDDDRVPSHVYPPGEWVGAEESETLIVRASSWRLQQVRGQIATRGLVESFWHVIAQDVLAQDPKSAVLFLMEDMDPETTLIRRLVLKGHYQVQEIPDPATWLPGAKP